MPLYLYQCAKCGLRLEQFMSVDKRDKASDCWCTHGSAGAYPPMDRVLTAPHLHGSPNMPND